MASTSFHLKEIPVKVESGSKHLTEDETFQKFDPIKACSWVQSLPRPDIFNNQLL